jgi:AGCS family alanine or glycine:cation symporter
VVLDSQYDETRPEHKAALFNYLNPAADSTVKPFSGTLHVDDGKILDGVSLLHARSLAEEVVITEAFSDRHFSGELQVRNGKLDITGSGIEITGKSLLHSAPLTTKAFSRGFLGDAGRFIIPISLLLFAFSTAIAWSYYGDRAVTFLWGNQYVRYYRVLYVIAFFAAAIIDTTIVWTFSGIAIALMTIPNIIGILLLRKEMKESVQDYWDKFEDPDAKD